MTKVIEVDFRRRRASSGSWQPIETAPKNGSEILVLIRFPRSCGMADAVVYTRWEDPKRRGEHGNRYKGWSGRWSGGLASLWEVESARGVPVLWMPIPGSEV